MERNDFTSAEISVQEKKQISVNNWKFDIFGKVWFFLPNVCF